MTNTTIDMMTVTEKTAAIRAALKAKGYTSKQVSVRAERFSMGSSITVRIKDATVPLSVVRDIAFPYGHIDRCAITGEILSGGNTYLEVEYTREARQAHSDAYAERVEAAVARVYDNVLIEVEGTPYSVGQGHRGGVAVWGGARVQQAYDVPGAAAVIGALMVESRHAGAARD